MGNATSRLPRPTVGDVERSLAALLVGLLGTYVVGRVVGDAAPVLDTIGVLAVHLAVVVGSVLPVVVLGRATSSLIRRDPTGPRFSEVGAAVATLGFFLAGFWLGGAAGANELLLASGGGALLVLAGLVVGRP